MDWAQNLLSIRSPEAIEDTYHKLDHQVLLGLLHKSEDIVQHAHIGEYLYLTIQHLREHPELWIFNYLEGVVMMCDSDSELKPEFEF